MRLWGKGWIVVLALLLGLTAPALAAQKAFLWNGTHWSQVSFDGKAGYVFGMGNLADFEAAADRGKSPCISKALAEELKNKTVEHIIGEVDKFYKENPDKMGTTVIEVILRRCTSICPPEAKSGGKK
jgi:hypothetical protein